jgi:drug/metabolite transporter (DMT)-like permease
VLFGGDLLGGDPIPWLVLALGGALAIGTGLALVRAQGDPDDGELERPPLARSIVMIAIGLVAALWALASLLKG